MRVTGQHRKALIRSLSGQPMAAGSSKAGRLPYYGTEVAARLKSLRKAIVPGGCRPPVSRGPAHRPAAVPSLHPEARELAQYGLPRRRPGAEKKFSVLARPCLEQAVIDCASERNAPAAPIDWRFIIRNAQTKLCRLYPCHP